MSTLVTNSLFEQLTSTFQELEVTNEPVFLKALRQAAFEKFSSEGFPTVKNEEWKYTNIQPLVNKSYVLNEDVDVANIDLSKADIPDFDAHRIVLINGQYMLSFSSLEDEDGLVVKAIDEAVNEVNFEKHFGQYADKTENVLVSLNTALYTSGLYLSVGKNKVISKPIHVIHVATGGQEFFAQTRNLLVIEQNAEVEIVETFITLDNTVKNLNNKVTEIVLQENAKVQHYYLQLADEVSNYINHTEVYQSKYSLYNNYNCNFPGAAFVRNNINVRLDAENVESHLYGINYSMIINQLLSS